eukprot:768033-Hanusia_phi.AAC.2
MRAPRLPDLPDMRRPTGLAVGPVALSASRISPTLLACIRGGGDGSSRKFHMGTVFAHISGGTGTPPSVQDPFVEIVAYPPAGGGEVPRGSAAFSATCLPSLLLLVHPFRAFHPSGDVSSFSSLLSIAPLVPCLQLATEGCSVIATVPTGNAAKISDPLHQIPGQDRDQMDSDTFLLVGFMALPLLFFLFSMFQRMSSQQRALPPGKPSRNGSNNDEGPPMPPVD